ncbi:Protein CBG28096 [Caenorhabditis briggsae]|uniref:Protein CBG28096 n=2 Tax=Caenorhabditis briggsae TaxID=6238 RepID=B6IGT5_CAEBR|nr:Protein CBG28096 [Caenorhabditis briggsae]ULT84957.1 hypothetical protein L3Y34_013560 [Caenorhabditis briggsae]CAR99115.1 Protein CBG28096 [Caenorhabditis briggsae]
MKYQSLLHLPLKKEDDPKQKCDCSWLQCAKTRLWMWTHPLQATVIFHFAVLLKALPDRYSFVRAQFWFSIGFAIYNILLTSGVAKKRCLLGFALKTSILNLFWAMMCLVTIPVVVTSVTMPYGEMCDPKQHICAKGLGGDEFQLQMLMGMLEELYFLIIFYAEIKRFFVLVELRDFASSQQNQDRLGEAIKML